MPDFTELFTHNTFHEVAQVGTFRELLRDHNAEASRLELVGAIMNDDIAPLEGPPESKNG